MSRTVSPFELRSRCADARTIAIAVGVSVLVHALALYHATPTARVALPAPGRPAAPLAVEILPPPAPPSPAPRSAELPAASQPATGPAARPKPKSAPPRATRPPRPSPPVLAEDGRPPEMAEAPRPPVAAPKPERSPAEPDLASYIEARRRARAEVSPQEHPVRQEPQREPAEDANARATRLAAANLAASGAPAFGYDARRGGGIFSIRHVAYDYAEFMFYGWNRDARRNTAQLVEVRKADAPDIRIAIVRRMVAIIREYEHDRFQWDSRRLGRYVTLSAHPRDAAGLEDFLMAEFFGDGPPPR